MAPGLASTVRLYIACSTMPSLLITALASPTSVIGTSISMATSALTRRRSMCMTFAADRMALQVLHDRELVAGAVDRQLDDGVQAGVGGQDVAQLAPVDGDRHRVLAQPVDGGGHLALGAQSSARS